MRYQIPEVASAAKKLKKTIPDLDNPRAILRDPALTALFERLKTLPANQRGAFGKEVNLLKSELEKLAAQSQEKQVELPAIDVTAPFDANSHKPQLLPSEQGSRHPLMVEMDNIIEIFLRMGFDAVESRQLDDDYHMFTSLNFAKNHPARADYDSFVTTEGLFAPAHTSTMQNRLLKKHRGNLNKGQAIAVVIPGRTFRNDDIDARHDHTFHQLEGIYVDRGINAGNLTATIRAWLSEYFGREIKIKIQPFYFPFTEPSFEFAASCPFCDEKGCTVCGHSGWIELGGCGMIHPNVLKEAGIDAAEFTGFAWGFGIERLVMLKYGIEDIRNFHSGNLKFLEQFK